MPSASSPPSTTVRRNLRLFDVAVVIPTVGRPTLKRTVESVYAQQFKGTIQLLLGVDGPVSDSATISHLVAGTPSHVHVSVYAPGYSTSARFGGVHPAGAGGALRTILSYAAHSKRVAYLDDDNWWSPDHLATLVKAIEGHDWAYSLRWFCDPATGAPLCVDGWESVGPNAGSFRESFGGFADPNCLMIDPLACEPALRLWSQTLPGDKVGMTSDRVVFDWLHKHGRGIGTGKATAYYALGLADCNHSIRVRRINEVRRRAGQPEWHATGASTSPLPVEKTSAPAAPARVPAVAPFRPTAEGAGRKYVRVAVLEVDGVRFDQPEPTDPGGRRRYVICSTQRSGSTLLCRQLLNAGIGVPHEYFHVQHSARIRKRWGIDPRQRDEYIQTLFQKRTTPNNVWGTKLQWRQYLNARPEIAAVLGTPTRYIYLHRRDLAAQAVSLHLSQVSGVWGFDGKPTTPPQSSEWLLNAHALDLCQKKLKAEEAAWQAFFKERGIEPLVLCYEEYVRDQADAIGQIAKWLGLSAGEFLVPPPEPKENRLPMELEAARAELLGRLRTKTADTEPA